MYRNGSRTGDMYNAQALRANWNHSRVEFTIYGASRYDAMTTTPSRARFHRMPSYVANRDGNIPRLTVCYNFTIKLIHTYKSALYIYIRRDTRTKTSIEVAEDMVFEGDRELDREKKCNVNENIWWIDETTKRYSSMYSSRCATDSHKMCIQHRKREEWEAVTAKKKTPTASCAHILVNFTVGFSTKCDKLKSRSHRYDSLVLRNENDGHDGVKNRKLQAIAFKLWVNDVPSHSSWAIKICMNFWEICTFNHRKLSKLFQLSSISFRL